MEQESSAMTSNPGNVTGDEFVSGFALTGEFVKTLADKSFEVVGQRTQEVPDMDNPKLMKKKHILTIKLYDGTQIDYFPNKTSMTVIINKRGHKLSHWVGFKGKFITKNQVVGKTEKDVIYISEGA